MTSAGRPSFPSTGKVVAYAVVGVVGLGVVLGLFVRFVFSDSDNRGCPGTVADVLDRTVLDAPVAPLLIDLVSNEEEPAMEIAQAFRPMLYEGLRRGAAFELILDRGPDVPLDHDECLSGTNAFRVDRNTETRQRQDESTAVEAIERHIAEVIGNDEIVDPGGPTRLLVEGATHTASLQRQGRAVAGVWLWSDWLSANRKECLYVAGEANHSLIDAVVERCRAALHGIPVYTAELELLGVGSGGRSAGLEAFARDLASRMCQEMKGCHLP